MSAVSAELKRNEIMWRDSILCLPPGEAAALLLL